MNKSFCCPIKCVGRGDESGMEYIRDLEQNIRQEKGKGGVLVFDQLLLDKNLKVMNPNIM